MCLVMLWCLIPVNRVARVTMHSRSRNFKQLVFIFQSPHDAVKQQRSVILYCGRMWRYLAYFVQTLNTAVVKLVPC